MLKQKIDSLSKTIRNHRTAIELSFVAVTVGGVLYHLSTRKGDEDNAILFEASNDALIRIREHGGGYVYETPNFGNFMLSAI